MTNVLILAPKFPPETGGASVYFKQVVELLEDAEFGVTVFAPRHPEREYKTKENGAIIYRAFPPVGARFYSGLTDLDRFRWLLKRVDPDIAHVHPHFPQYRWFRHLLKAYRVPRIYDCRDQDFSRRFVRDGKYYFSATETIDDILTNGLAIEPNKITRTPVVMPDIEPETVNVGDGQHVGFVSDLVEHKGIEIAVQAVETLAEKRDITLHVAGCGKRENLVRQKENEAWLEYYGGVQHAESLGLIKAVDAMVMPSKREGRPRVALEAISLNTPVVATDAGDLPDVIGPAGVIVDRDVKPVRKGIRRVLRNGWHTRRASERDVCTSTDVLKENLIEVYQTLCS